MDNADCQSEDSHRYNGLATVEPDRMHAEPGFSQVTEKFAVKETKEQGI